MIIATIVGIILLAILFGGVLFYALDIGIALLIILGCVGLIALVCKLIGLPFKIFKRKKK